MALESLSQNSEEQILEVVLDAYSSILSGKTAGVLCFAVQNFIETKDSEGIPENIADAIRQGYILKQKEIIKYFKEKSAFVGVSKDTRVENFDWTLRYSLSSSKLQNLNQRVVMLSFETNEGEEKLFQLHENDLENLLTKCEQIESQLHNLRKLNIS